eukprot:Tbor_TRINITY_DN5917_c0_g1::TRINITY_DN5917_c0_g1_i1::g.19500::m.19500
MPSLRVQNNEEARLQRIERIERTRKYGILKGKKCAESFRACVEATDNIVVSAVCEKLLKKKTEMQTVEDRLTAENSLRQGDGMRSAYEFSENLAARALEERAAWKAEFQLQSARNILASQDVNIRNMKSVLRNDASTDQREKAKQMELERSKKFFRLTGEVRDITTLAVKDINNGGDNIKVFTPPDVSAEEAAASYATMRKMDLHSKRQLLTEKLQNTRKRAVKNIAEKKAEKEKDQQAGEHDRLLKQSIVDYATHSICPNKMHTFQEQDARRSMEITGKVEKEFEEAFLKGPWPWDSIAKNHLSPLVISGFEKHQDIYDPFNIHKFDGFELFDPICLRNLSSVSYVDVGASPHSIHRLRTDPFTTNGIVPELLIGKTYLKRSDEDLILDGEYFDDSHNVVSIYEDIEPTPHNGMIPEPTPTTAVCIQSDSIHTSSSLPPIAPRISTAKLLPDNAEERDISDELQERNAQFLRELGLLQRRLQYAKSVTAKLHSSFCTPSLEIASKSKFDSICLQSSSTLASFCSDIESDCVSPMSTP